MSKNAEAGQPVIVGVMGGGEGATARDVEAAAQLGRFIGSRGWVLLCGGRDAGVMAAASRAALEQGGLTLGILPGDSRDGCCESVLLPIVTGMGSARNNINVLSSDIVLAVAYGLGPGTASEVALALKAGKPVVLLTDQEHIIEFFKNLRRNPPLLAGKVAEAQSILETLVAKHFPHARRLSLEGDSPARLSSGHPP